MPRNTQDRELESLRLLAERFRLAIQATPTELYCWYGKKFPHCACEEASILLGAYLADNGFPNFLLMYGDRVPEAQGESSYHAWLQRIDGLIVDITADQFRDAPRDVIVSRDSQWHQRVFPDDIFQDNIGYLQSGDYRKHHPATYEKRDAAYKNILSNLVDH